MIAGPVLPLAGPSRPSPPLTCGHAHLSLARVKLQVEVLDQQRERHDGLKERKLLTDALALAPPKGQVAVLLRHLIGDGAVHWKPVWETKGFKRGPKHVSLCGTCMYGRGGPGR